MNVQSKTIDQRAFLRLERLFLITLGFIAMCLFGGYLIINSFIKDQKNDAHFLNNAGRQRMLSQKITKNILKIQSSPFTPAVLNELSQDLTVWESTHKAINNAAQNADFDQQLLLTLDQSFQIIFKAASSAVETFKKNSSSSTIQEQTTRILEIEPRYLEQMDGLVKQYELQATQKVEHLQTLQLFVLILGILILLLAFFLILRPAAKHSSHIIKQLLTAQATAQEMARNADKLSQEKEQSVHQLKALNGVMEQSLLFARIDPQGYLISVGSKFSKFFNYNSNNDSKFSAVIAKEEKDQEYLNNILDAHKNTGWQGEIKGSTSEGEDCWLEISINPYQTIDQQQALLVICFDITQRKKAQHKINQLTKAHFQSEMERQKELSSKIIENQEQEQNRIAKDIHDGIGQMLTGLKFNIESIDVRNSEKTVEKIEQLKVLSSEIIRGVRTATFNLSPPELMDYGIVASITKLSQELSKFTGKEIQTLNKTEFNQRLDALVEINIYRIVQEAVNNAIKYAESTQIVISIFHTQDMLSILIDDNGKGFNPDQTTRDTNHEGGMGLTFMKERISYIDGRLFITSNPEVGTRVTLNIPI